MKFLAAIVLLAMAASGCSGLVWDSCDGKFVDPQSREYIQCQQELRWKEKHPDYQIP